MPLNVNAFARPDGDELGDRLELTVSLNGGVKMASKTPYRKAGITSADGSPWRISILQPKKSR